MSGLETWKDALRAGARRDPQRVVLRWQQQSYSYARLDAAAQALAEQLGPLAPGARVALAAASSPLSLLLGFACWRRGATLVPLNTRLSTSEQDQLLADCAPALLISDGSYAGEHSRLSWQQLQERPRRPCPPRSVDPEDAALILYTSGSTGRPKGVLLSFRMLAANIANTVAGFGLYPQDRTLLYAPLFHTGGWNVLTLPLLSIGGCTRILPRFDPDEVLVHLPDATVLFGVPTMFRMLLDAGLGTGKHTGLRFVISGGAPCPVSLIEAYLDRGIPFRQGYGMTEVGPNCFRFPAGQERAKAGSVGLPMPGTRVRLDRDGELLIAGRHLFSGYLNQPARSREVLSEGYLRSGDLAEVDADGCFRIIGRKKEMYISGGENVYPAEVECSLLEHPDLAEVAVVGVPDPRWGEVGCACVVPRRPGFDAEALRAHCDGRLARYKHPRHLRVYRELPRSALGKVLREQLLREFLVSEPLVAPC